MTNPNGNKIAVDRRRRRRPRQARTCAAVACSPVPLFVGTRRECRGRPQAEGAGLTATPTPCRKNEYSYQHAASASASATARSGQSGRGGRGCVRRGRTRGSARWYGHRPSGRPRSARCGSADLGSGTGTAHVSCARAVVGPALYAPCFSGLDPGLGGYSVAFGVFWLSGFSDAARHDAGASWQIRSNAPPQSPQHRTYTPPVLPPFNRMLRWLLHRGSPWWFLRACLERWPVGLAAPSCCNARV